MDEVVRLGGGRPILESGRTLNGIADPMLFVLLNSDAVPVLIEKEARLGRFIHSRHVVQIVESGERFIELEHISNVDDPPRWTEDLAGAGQHISLLEQIGCSGLSLSLPRSRAPSERCYSDGVYREPARGDGSCWRFEWRAFLPSRRPMPGLDEILMSRDGPRALQETTPRVAEVEAVVRADLARSWTLSNVAARLNTSSRTLQRELAAESTKFSEVLERLRLTEAQRLLDGSDLSVTDIGCVCGFADNSHFTRRFKKRLGLTPSKYKQRRG
ncbi:MAG: AraC family transcriptional regulator [Myxococcota bacterium]